MFNSFYDIIMATDYPMFHLIMSVCSISFGLAIVGILYYEMIRLLINGE
jgi:hypothetical protein